MILADLHTHSLASQDAFSTVTEVCQAAAKRGLKYVAVTDHGPAMPIGQHPYHFQAMAALPKFMSGVRLLKGAEANILPDGTIDIEPRVAASLEFMIIAYHLVWEFPDKAANTKNLVRLLEEKRGHMLAHPYHPWIELELNPVMEALAASGTVLELNEKALQRADQAWVEPVIQKALAKGVLFGLGSDSHYHEDVGSFTRCLEIINQYDIPQARIINYQEELLRNLLERGRTP